MTATPDKRDDNMEGRNVYELFNYQIAYEIRLQQGNGRKSALSVPLFWNNRFINYCDAENASRDFSMLTSDERVKHIISQADYYGYSGEKSKD